MAPYKGTKDWVHSISHSLPIAPTASVRLSGRPESSESDLRHLEGHWTRTAGAGDHGAPFGRQKEGTSGLGDPYGFVLN